MKKRWDNNEEYDIELLQNQKWLEFKGIWGVGGLAPSPNGPVFRHSKPDAGNLWQTPVAYMWVDPIYWSGII